MLTIHAAADWGTCCLLLHFIAILQSSKVQTVSFQSRQWQCNSYFQQDKRSKVQLRNIDDCEKNHILELIQRLQAEFPVTSYLKDDPEWVKAWAVVPWCSSVCSEDCLFVDCLTSQQHASVSQGRICSDNLTCCHTEIEVADPTFHLTQSQYTDTGPTSPSTDPITPGAWQGSHWSAYFKLTGMTLPWKNPSASGIRTRDLPL